MYMKIIRNESDYEHALKRIDELVDIDPEENTPEAEEMDLLALLINKYEDEVYPIDIPDPVEAIKFRMDQMGLKNKDMIPYFGTKSKVSEVLNRKRNLSLSMIRALNRDLGIPAEVLIADSKKNIPAEIEGIEWTRFPVAEMLKLGWIDFSGSFQSAKEQSEEIIRSFFDTAGFDIDKNLVFFRNGIRSDKEINDYALTAWYAKVLFEQKAVVPEISYDKKVLNKDFFDDLKHLSFFDEGPQLAREFLLKLGIKLIIVPHLKGTHLDGAVFFNKNKEPIVAMTLRYDRIDNFWFTLFHELSHLLLHFKNIDVHYFDDLKSTKNISDIEKEADEYAENKLISLKMWKSFYSPFLNEKDIITFAYENRVSPAIIAGRLQKERNDFRIFRKLLGQNTVRDTIEKSLH